MPTALAHPRKAKPQYPEPVANAHNGRQAQPRSAPTAYVLTFAAPMLRKDSRPMTASQNGLFRQVVALAPAAVLRSLAAGSDEPPEVSVCLSSGQVLGGRLVRVGTDHGQEVAVLADARTGQLCYLLLGNVVAVEVPAAERYRDVLTEGRLAPPVTGEPITLLALRREFAPSPQFPLEVDWRALPGSDAALANLDRLLRTLRDCVGDVCTDEMGRQAWARIRTLTVAHQSDASLSIEQAPDGLAVHADLVAALPRNLNDELRRQLNELL